MPLLSELRRVQRLHCEGPTRHSTGGDGCRWQQLLQARRAGARVRAALDGHRRRGPAEPERLGSPRLQLLRLRRQDDRWTEVHLHGLRQHALLRALRLLRRARGGGARAAPDAACEPHRPTWDNSCGCFHSASQSGGCSSRGGQACCVAKVLLLRLAATRGGCTRAQEAVPVAIARKTTVRGDTGEGEITRKTGKQTELARYYCSSE